MKISQIERGTLYALISILIEGIININRFSSQFCGAGNIFSQSMVYFVLEISGDFEHTEEIIFLNSTQRFNNRNVDREME